MSPFIKKNKKIKKPVFLYQSSIYSGHLSYKKKTLKKLLKISSKIFNGISKIEQHKLVYKSLKGKMGNELHALSITTEGK